MSCDGDNSHDLLYANSKDKNSFCAWTLATAKVP